MTSRKVCILLLLLLGMSIIIGCGESKKDIGEYVGEKIEENVESLGKKIKDIVYVERDFEGMKILNEPLSEDEIHERIAEHQQQTSPDYNIYQFVNDSAYFNSIEDNFIISYVDDPQKYYIYDFLSNLYVDSTLDDFRANSDSLVVEMSQAEKTVYTDLELGMYPEVMVYGELPYYMQVDTITVNMYDAYGNYLQCDYNGEILQGYDKDEDIKNLVRYAAQYQICMSGWMYPQEPSHVWDYISVEGEFEEGADGVYYMNIVMENSSTNIIYGDLDITYMDINLKDLVEDEYLSPLYPGEKRLVRVKFFDVNDPYDIHYVTEDIIYYLKIMGDFEHVPLQYTSTPKPYLEDEAKTFYCSYFYNMENVHKVSVLNVEESEYISGLFKEWLRPLILMFPTTKPRQDEGRYFVDIDEVSQLIDTRSAPEKISNLNQLYKGYTQPTERINEIFPEFEILYNDTEQMITNLINKDTCPYETIKELYEKIYDNLTGIKTKLANIGIS